MHFYFYSSGIYNVARLRTELLFNNTSLVPRPIPSCSACNIEKLGMGLGTKLQQYTASKKTPCRFPFRSVPFRDPEYAWHFAHAWNHVEEVTSSWHLLSQNAYCGSHQVQIIFSPLLKASVILYAPSSGGKDSCYNMIKCVAAGHEIVALANLRPAEKGPSLSPNY